MILGRSAGQFRVGWIVLCTMFVYENAFFTGRLERVKPAIVAPPDDERMGLSAA
jgi:hypothetical protein